MYIILEYLTYLILIAFLGGALFAASATVLITKEGARRAAASSRRLASQGAELLGKHLAALSTLQPRSSHLGE